MIRRSIVEIGDDSAAVDAVFAYWDCPGARSPSRETEIRFTRAATVTPT